MDLPRDKKLLSVIYSICYGVILGIAIILLLTSFYLKGNMMIRIVYFISSIELVSLTYRKDKSMTIFVLTALSILFLTISGLLMIYEGPIFATSIIISIVFTILLSPHTTGRKNKQQYKDVITFLLTVLLIMISSAQISTIRPIIFHPVYECPEYIYPGNTTIINITLGNYGKIPVGINFYAKGENILLTSPYLKSYPYNFRESLKYTTILLPIQYEKNQQKPFVFLIKISNQTKESSSFEIEFRKIIIDSPLGEGYYKLIASKLETLGLARYTVLKFECKYEKHGKIYKHVS